MSLRRCPSQNGLSPIACCCCGFQAPTPCKDFSLWLPGDFRSRGPVLSGSRPIAPVRDTRWVPAMVLARTQSFVGKGHEGRPAGSVPASASWWSSRAGCTARSPIVFVLVSSSFILDRIWNYSRVRHYRGGIAMATRLACSIVDQLKRGGSRRRSWARSDACRLERMPCSTLYTLTVPEQPAVDKGLVRRCHFDRVTRAHRPGAHHAAWPPW
jgi:hypothetical protein